jgi:hypothetical protein
MSCQVVASETCCLNSLGLIREGVRAVMLVGLEPAKNFGQDPPSVSYGAAEARVSPLTEKSSPPFSG